MRYERAKDLEEKIKDIVEKLNINYVNIERIACFRSYGTNSRRVIARCHGLPKVMQLGMNTDAFYVIEVLSERFDRMNEEEKTKVLIHELLHIPKSFGGGFRQHDYVNRRTVEKFYSDYKRKTEETSQKINIQDEIEVESIKNENIGLIDRMKFFLNKEKDNKSE
ncbi:MAG: putative metallopeptidase [Candidatus Micrarchaeia archaeon]